MERTLWLTVPPWLSKTQIFTVLHQASRSPRRLCQSGQLIPVSRMISIPAQAYPWRRGPCMSHTDSAWHLQFLMQFIWVPKPSVRPLSPSSCTLLRRVPEQVHG
jgi:hypothetical protein